MLKAPSEGLHSNAIKTKVFSHRRLTHSAFSGYGWNPEALAMQGNHHAAHSFEQMAAFFEMAEEVSKQVPQLSYQPDR